MAMASGVQRAALIVCGTVCVALGVIGIFLPLMPTTVFLLAAAACYARSSERFYHQLTGHPWLGGYIRNQHEGRGMRRRDKVFTLASLWVGIGAAALWAAQTAWLRVLLVAIAIAVTLHIVRLPTFVADEAR